MGRPEADRFGDLPILTELRAQLAGEMTGRQPAAFVRRSAARTGAGRLLLGVRALPVALAVVITLAVAAAIIAGHHHAPARSGDGRVPFHRVPSPSGPAQNQASAAIRQTQHADSVCRQRMVHGPTIQHGSPGSLLLSRFGVLRRAPLPADRTSRVLYRIGWNAGSGVYVDAIRRARTVYGRSYWIVPVARMTPFAPTPARCYSEYRATLRRDLARASARTRSQALAALNGDIQGQQAESADQEGLCFIGIGVDTRPRPGAVGYGCSPAQQVGVPIAGADGSGDRAGGTILAGLAQDGINAVVLRYRMSGGVSAATLTAPVVDNVYVFRIPPRVARGGQISAVLVRLADGRLIASSQLPAGGHGSG